MMTKVNKRNKQATMALWTGGKMICARRDSKLGYAAVPQMMCCAASAQDELMVLRYVGGRRDIDTHTTAVYAGLRWFGNDKDQT